MVALLTYFPLSELEWTCCVLLTVCKEVSLIANTTLQKRLPYRTHHAPLSLDDDPKQVSGSRVQNTVTTTNIHMQWKTGRERMTHFFQTASLPCSHFQSCTVHTPEQGTNATMLCVLFWPAFSMLHKINQSHSRRNGNPNSCPHKKMRHSQSTVRTALVRIV